MVDIIVEKYSYGFRIVLSEEESYFITDYEQKYCLIDFEIKREVKDISGSTYEDFGVKNLDELFCLLVREPRRTLEMLTGYDFPIDRITIEYYEK